MEAILKTAAIFVAREMCNGPIAKNVFSVSPKCMFAKSHACIAKGTIPSKKMSLICFLAKYEHSFKYLSFINISTELRQDLHNKFHHIHHLYVKLHL